MIKKKPNFNHQLPYLVWFLGAFFFFIDYIIRVSPSVLTSTLMQLFDANAFTIGLFSAFFYYAYIGMQIPVGILVDRFSPKYLLCMSSLLCALSTFMFAEMQHIFLGFFSRFLMGFGASFAFVGTLKLISVWFKSEKFAFLAGLTQTMGMIGAMVGQGQMALVYQSWGWRLGMYLLGTLLLITSLLMLFFINEQNNSLAEEQLVPVQEINIWQSLKMILSNSQNWLNCLFIGLIYAPSACFGEQWGASFLSINQGISIEMAGQETGIMFIGLAIGCPILGWISDKTKHRLLIMRLSALICCILLSIVIYGSLLPEYKFLNPIMYTFILFVYGFFNSGIVCSYALASEINPRQRVGIALGITNMASVLIGALMIPIIGLILDTLSKSTIATPLHVFTVKQYQIAFATLPIGFIIAFAISFFQKEHPLAV